MTTPTPLPFAAPSDGDRRRSRAGAIAWANAVACRPDVAYLDTETTGIDGRAEIVEIAVIDCDGTPLLDTLVRPDGIIPREVIRIHGIDNTMVEDAPRWPEVYPVLLELIRDRTVIVYNADFDHRLVNQMNRRCGFLPRSDRWECAMRQYAAFATEWHARYGNYRWHKLDVALARFGHHGANNHRARGDALACRLVVEEMRDAGRGTWDANPR